MIIECPKCNKKFQIDQNLIPINGRTLQCGSCDHKWFFKFENKKKEEKEEIQIDEKISDFQENTNFEENIVKKEFTVLDARSRNRFLGLEPEPRPGIKSGSIEGSKSMPLNKIVNAEDNTFLDTKKLRDIFDLSQINSNKIVMSCGSSVSAATLALAYSLINDDYIPKIYIGSWTEFGKK